MVDRPFIDWVEENASFDPLNEARCRVEEHLKRERLQRQKYDAAEELRTHIDAGKDKGHLLVEEDIFRRILSLVLLLDDDPGIAWTRTWVRYKGITFTTCKWDTLL